MTSTKKAVRKVPTLLSEREREFLDSTIDPNILTVEDAARKVGITTRAAYNLLFRLRRKQDMARAFTNKLLNYRRRNYLLNKVLRRRVTIQEEELQRDFEKEEEKDLDRWGRNAR